MALVTVQGGVWIPELLNVSATPNLGATTAMSAGTHKIATVLEVPTTGTITHLGFRTLTVTTSDSVDVGLYTVDSSGNPTGTAYGGMTVGTQASIASNTGYTVALGTNATATAGDIVAIVLTFTSFVAGNFTATLVTASDARSGMPYSNYFGGVSWVKARAWPVNWVQYSGTTYNYIPHVFPITTITAQSYAVNTGGTDEYALTFTLPFPCRCAGAVVWVTGSGAFELTLYSGTTALQTYAYPAGVTSGNNGPVFLKFPTGQALTASTQYRLSLRPTTTTSITLQIYTTPNAQSQDQMGGGQNFLLGKRVDQGAWAADVATQRPLISLLFDQVDDGTGGGGGLAACPLGGYVR